MRKASSLLLLAASAMLSTLTFAADAPAVSGRWTLQNNFSGVQSQSDCMFAEKNAELTGTCITESGASRPVKGKVDGKNVTFQFTVDYQGSPLTLLYSGELGQDKKIAGTVTVQEMGVDGEFTATEAK